MSKGVPFTRAQKLIHYGGAMANMKAADVQEILDELVEYIQKHGGLPALDAGSFGTNQTWAPRYRVFPRLLRADVQKTNEALAIWTDMNLENQMLTLPLD